MFIDLPETETCPRCKRAVVVVAIEAPADQWSECTDDACPLNAKYLKPRPEFPEPDELLLAHQLSFADESK